MNTIKNRQNRPSRTTPGAVVCSCRRGYAAAHDNRCGYCRDEEVRRLQRKGRPWRHLCAGHSIF